MYYKLTTSVDTKIIGNVNSQTEEALFPQVLEGQLFSRDIFLKKVDNPATVLTPTAILKYKAKLTDVIGGASTTIGGQLLMSNKLKVILEGIAGAKVQFFPLSIIYKNETLPSYWIMCAYDTDMESIDYRQSNIELVGLGSTKIKDISVNSYDDFQSLVESTALPERLAITKVSILKECTKELLVLRWVEGGIGFYVNEKVKSEIENAGCIGVHFTLV